MASLAGAHAPSAHGLRPRGQRVISCFKPYGGCRDDEKIGLVSIYTLHLGEHISKVCDAAN